MAVCAQGIGKHCMAHRKEKKKIQAEKKQKQKIIIIEQFEGTKVRLRNVVSSSLNLSSAVDDWGRL